MITARTRETPDERALPCGGTYAAYFLTSLNEVDPHIIARSEKHWDYRYPGLGRVWTGSLDEASIEVGLQWLIEDMQRGILDAMLSYPKIPYDDPRLDETLRELGRRAALHVPKVDFVMEVE